MLDNTIVVSTVCDMVLGNYSCKKSTDMLNNFIRTNNARQPHDGRVKLYVDSHTTKYQIAA